MKKIILMLMALSTNVFAAPTISSGSATAPLASGKTYYFKSDVTCRITGGADILVDITHEMQEGQRTFTASTSAYSPWLIAQGVSPPPLSNNTNMYVVDESASTTAYLTETPVQWGSFTLVRKIIAFSNNSAATSSDYHSNGGGKFVLVKFEYSNTNGSSVKTTGYAIYAGNSSGSSWKRLVINFSAFTNTTGATQWTYIGKNAETISGSPATCFEEGHHFQ